jgi:hypothetical protein
MSTVHNPANVPEDKLPKGYRFLDTDEVGTQFITEIPKLYAWLEEEKRWRSHAFGSSAELTYFTPHSRAELRALRGLPPEEPAKPDHPVESDEVMRLKARIAELEGELANEETDFLDRAALAALPAILEWDCTEEDPARYAYSQARAMLAERRRVREDMRKETTP